MRTQSVHRRHVESPASAKLISTRKTSPIAHHRPSTARTRSLCRLIQPTALGRQTSAAHAACWTVETTPAAPLKDRDKSTTLGSQNSARGRRLVQRGERPRGIARFQTAAPLAPTCRARRLARRQRRPKRPPLARWSGRIPCLNGFRRFVVVRIRLGVDGRACQRNATCRVGGAASIA